MLSRDECDAYVSLVFFINLFSLLIQFVFFFLILLDFLTWILDHVYGKHLRNFPNIELQSISRPIYLRQDQFICKSSHISTISIPPWICDLMMEFSLETVLEEKSDCRVALAVAGVWIY